MSDDYKRQDASQSSQESQPTLSTPTVSPLDRRKFVVGAAAVGAGLAMPRWAAAAEKQQNST